MLAAGLAAVGIGEVPVEAKSIVPEKLSSKELLWGTYGPNAIYWPSLKMVKLDDCDTDHLQNILRTEDWHLNDTYRNAISEILRERGVIPIPKEQRCYTRELRLAFEDQRREKLWAEITS